MVSFDNEELFSRVFSEIVPKIVGEYLSAKGITLFNFQLRNIKKMVENNTLSTIRVYWFNTLRTSLSTKAEIESYISGLGEFLELSIKKLLLEIENEDNKIFQDVLKTSSRLLVRQLRKSGKKMLSDRDRIASLWTSRISQEHGDQLRELRMMIEVAKDIYRDYSTFVSSGTSAREEASRMLLAQACLVSSEILTLLRNGFPDGALARWRTLHETVVVFLFLKDKPTTTSEMFLEHSIVTTYNELVTYQERADALGFEKVLPEDENRTTAEYSETIAKYEPGFLSDYGWAYKEFPTTIKRITFWHLENSIGQAYLRPYYKMSCNSIHASSKGATFRLGAGTDGQLVVGESAFGLYDPIQLTAIELNKIIVNILGESMGTFGTIIKLASLEITTSICYRGQTN